MASLPSCQCTGHPLRVWGLGTVLGILDYATHYTVLLFRWGSLIGRTSENFLPWLICFIIEKAAVYKGSVLWAAHLKPGFPLDLESRPLMNGGIATVLLIGSGIPFGSPDIARSDISYDWRSKAAGGQDEASHLAQG